LGQFHLDAGFGFEFLDGLEKRVVFRFVEALHPPDGQSFLSDGRGGCLARKERENGRSYGDP
jgi:hypothetical protein